MVFPRPLPVHVVLSSIPIPQVYDKLQGPALTPDHVATELQAHQKGASLAEVFGPDSQYDTGREVWVAKYCWETL